MAFTGVARVVALGRHIVRITGIHLDGGQTGIIGLAGDAGADVQLPASFPTAADADIIARGLNMTDVVECRTHDTSVGGGANNHYHQNQSLNPFRISLVNDGAQATADLDIYIQYFHSLTR